MADPENYQYDIDVSEVAELWRLGSVVGSWLLDLTADVLRSDRELNKFDGGVSDSGEGRWTVHSCGSRCSSPCYYYCSLLKI